MGLTGMREKYIIVSRRVLDEIKIKKKHMKNNMGIYSAIVYYRDCNATTHVIFWTGPSLFTFPGVRRNTRRSHAETPVSAQSSKAVETDGQLRRDSSL